MTYPICRHGTHKYNIWAHQYSSLSFKYWIESCLFLKALRVIIFVFFKTPPLLSTEASPLKCYKRHFQFNKYISMFLPMYHFQKFIKPIFMFPKSYISNTFAMKIKSDDLLKEWLTKTKLKPYHLKKVVANWFLISLSLINYNQFST